MALAGGLSGRGTPGESECHRRELETDIEPTLKTCCWDCFFIAVGMSIDVLHPGADGGDFAGLSRPELVLIAACLP
jgi:hypothetical protein